LNRKSAEDFVCKYQAYGNLLNEITELSVRMENKEAAKRIRKSIADTHNVLYEYVVFDIGKAYPDLVPKD
jgi:hypothetical protein